MNMHLCSDDEACHGTDLDDVSLWGLCHVRTTWYFSALCLSPCTGTHRCSATARQIATRTRAFWCCDAGLRAVERSLTLVSYRALLSPSARCRCTLACALVCGCGAPIFVCARPFCRLKFPPSHGSMHRLAWPLLSQLTTHARLLSSPPCRGAALFLRSVFFFAVIPCIPGASSIQTQPVRIAITLTLTPLRTSLPKVDASALCARLHFDVFCDVR